MVSKTTLLALVVAITMTLCQGQGQDSTLLNGARGAAVVDAVVSRIRSRCIFSEDRLFLRRLAYVMSRDGDDSKTYRVGFHGGIWQVSESMFTATTKACGSSGTVRTACASITSAFAIHWPSVTWSDLRKPLYSGLAATLSTLLTLGTQPMPGSLSGQAAIWKRMYGTGAVGTEFQDKAAGMDKSDCSEALDLAFLLDSSGSVINSDFKLMLRFAGDVINGMDISPAAVRVAHLTFSNSVKVQYDFNDYSTKAQAHSLMINTVKISGGTNTAAGLQQVARTMYDAAAGARPNAKKVAILVTDGQSNSLASTSAAAKALRDLGTTVFAVGVGNYKLIELQAVASDPTCAHVMTLASFDHIQAILTELKKSACNANTVIKADTGTMNGTLPSEETATTLVPTDANKTIEAVVTCGILDVYTSITDPKPSSAVYDELYRATPGNPAYLTLVETLPAGSPVYVTVVGTRLPPNAAAARKCSDYSWSLGVARKKNIAVICEEDGVRRQCTNSDVVRAGLCKDNDVNFPVDNPCTSDNLQNEILRHRYIYDVTKFLQCDLQGNYYITSCPGGSIFNVQNRACGLTSGAPSTSDGTQAKTGESKPKSSSGALVPLPSASLNPCTPKAIANRNFYHTYAPSQSKFVQCDEWGKAWVMPCAPSTIWSQSHYTCIKKSKVSSALVSCSASDTYLADPCDHRQFYQCVHGQPQRKACSSGLFYHPGDETCDHGDTNTASIPALCANASD